MAGRSDGRSCSSLDQGPSTVGEVDDHRRHQRDADVQHHRQGEHGDRRRAVAHGGLCDEREVVVTDRRPRRGVLDQVEVLVADQGGWRSGTPAAGSRTTFAGTRSERLRRRLRPATWYGLDGTAHDLGDVARGVDHEREEQREERRVDPDAANGLAAIEFPARSTRTRARSIR